MEDEGCYKEEPREGGVERKIAVPRAHLTTPSSAMVTICHQQQC